MSGIFTGSSMGVLGAPMATGPGGAYDDGSLGAAMAMGPGGAYQDGSLGCAACGIGMRGLGETSVAVPTTLILGAMIGAAAMYWLQDKKPAMAANGRRKRRVSRGRRRH